MPNTRRIGMAKLELVYCVGGRRIGIAAIPDVAPPHRAGGVAMDEHRGERAGDGEEKQDQEAVVGAAGVGDRHDRRPRQERLHRHARADEALHHRREHVDEQPRQHAGDEAERGQDEHGGEREPIDLLRALGLRRPRPAEEDHAISLDEAGGGERGRQREQRADRRDHEAQAPLRQTGPDEDGLEGQPFRDEAVERRQRRDRGAADEERDSGPRHAMDEAAEVLHVALAGRGEHGAGAEEQQALEDRMIEHMKQRGGQRERRRQLHAAWRGTPAPGQGR